MHIICCYSKLTLWIQEHCMQNSALFTGEQQVCRGNSIHSMTTLLQLTEAARATCEHEQLFRHYVLTWIPPFAPTLPTSASTTVNTYMSFHIFLLEVKLEVK